VIEDRRTRDIGCLGDIVNRSARHALLFKETLCDIQKALMHRLPLSLPATYLNHEIHA